jgi:hypothetical protein
VESGVPSIRYTSPTAGAPGSDENCCLVPVIAPAVVAASMATTMFLFAMNV